MAFHANCVAVDDMEDFWLVGFADEKFDTKQYLMLQRSYDEDEQDARLGMDTYYVERDGQEYSGYGGIERFELYKDKVVVRFTQDGAKRLGDVAEMDITFTPLGWQKARKLKNRLQRVFAGTECFQDRTA